MNNSQKITIIIFLNFPSEISISTKTYYKHIKRNVKLLPPTIVFGAEPFDVAVLLLAGRPYCPGIGVGAPSEPEISHSLKAEHATIFYVHSHVLISQTM